LRVAKQRQELMPGVRINPLERRELEEELGRLEAERQSLSSQIDRARAQAPRPAEHLDLRDALDDFTLIEGRLRQLRAVLAAAEPRDR
jgi:transcription elongation GreA/GreB family factor